MSLDNRERFHRSERSDEKQAPLSIERKKAETRFTSHYPVSH